MTDKTRVMILLSGRGSNFIALADDMAVNPHHQIIAVASDNPKATGLDYARKKNIPLLLLDYNAGRAAAEKTLQEFIAREQIYYILLAGFMKILSPDFARQFKNRILNIHPSLLPKYPGLDTHQRAIAAGDKEHGCSVHIVDETLDGGPLLAQRAVRVLPNDTAGSLADKVLALEHELYPFVLQNIESLIKQEHEQ
ncbi:MAG: phosphoribosylglycinamide formyltransferase [Hydrotalea sp.]|nr:phosphoribosylglycinamide formyltransferase [Hydrotalea sp.]